MKSINRRNFIKGSLVAGAFTATPTWLMSKSKNSKRPNIIFLFTDDQSPYLMGYDNPDIKTPIMDDLANKGIIFDNFYCSTAICMASRAIAMTGMYEFKNGCNFQHGPLRKDYFEQSYPVLLKNSGYHTGFIGKFGYAVRDFKPGEKTKKSYGKVEDLELAGSYFDFWGGWPSQGEVITEKCKNPIVQKYASKYPHITRAVGATAQEYITKASKIDKPFSLSVSFKVPHSPYMADKIYDDLYPAGYKFTRRPNFNTTVGLPPQALSDRQYPKGEKWVDKHDQNMNVQARMIKGVDDAVGMIVEQLKKEKVLDNTVIIYTTDNGYFQGAHRLGGKVLPYEEGTRAPSWMIDFRKNSPSSGKRINGVCSTVDVAPTILSLAGVTPPTKMDGKDISVYLDDIDAKVHDDTLLVQCWSGFSEDASRALAVVTEKYKYIYWFYQGGEMKPVEQLYDLEKDPFELKDLAGDKKSSKALKDMQSRYDKYIELIKTEGIDFNDYGRYKVLYDRNASYEDKKPLLKHPYPPEKKKPKTNKKNKKDKKKK